MTAPGLYSRPRICREFKISDRTLIKLERTGLLALAWSTENGQLMTAVSEADARRLSVAQLAVDSFPLGNKQLHRWPFHRFLTLRFLQVQNENLEDLHTELVQRNLISETAFTFDKLRALHETFIRKLPKELHYLARFKRAPETDEEKEFFSYLLDTLEVRAIYEHPEYEQGFEFMVDEVVKDVVDAALTTRSDFASIRDFLASAISLHIVSEGLLIYQVLFHDINLLTPEEVKNFLKNTKPSQRSRLSMAIGQTLDIFRVRSGIDDKLKSDQTFEFLRDRLVENLVRTVDVHTEDAEKSFMHSLRSLMVITERLDQLKPADTQDSGLPPFMRSMELKPVSMAEQGIFQLPAATESVKEENG